MGRLIDVNAVIKAIDKHTFDTDDGLCLDDDITCILEEVPTIEERKTGKWINAYPDIEPNPMLMYGICSVCGFEQSISDKLKYCPNCGARMVQEGEDNEQVN